MIKLTNWEESVEDVVSYSFIELAEKEYGGDYIAAYEDTNDGHVPSSISIFQIMFTHENIEEGHLLSLYCDDESEKEWIKDYISENQYPAVLIYEDIDTLEYRFEESVNVRDLFVYHSELVTIAL